MELEYQSYDLELKDISQVDRANYSFEGFASTFGNTDKVQDIVEKGAFLESIESLTPTILFMHDPEQPVGMPTELRETDEGLYIKAKMPRDDALVRDRIVPQMKIGSIAKMSIGFRIAEEGSYIDELGIRHITKADLREISLVTTNFEANGLADIMSIKSKVGEISSDKLKAMTARELEKCLRDSGLFSKSAAVTVASYHQRDSEDVTKNDDTDEFGYLIDMVRTLNLNTKLSDAKKGN
mgnify:FL=1|tara:strand:- start:27318 stop:28034 length:717 start_codon:yes stop_codon:yes gene_type:complete